MNHLRKLTYNEYIEIQTQYEQTPDQYSFSPTGEHYQLRHMLVQMGYKVATSRGAELELASRLLSQGYTR